MDSGFLLPDVDDPGSKPFWDGCATGTLLVQACSDCGARRMPPRPMCPQCQSIRCDWLPTSGAGTVWSFVVPHPPLLPAYTAVAPYNVVVVALDDDPRIRFVGNLVEPGAPAMRGVDPTTIRIGEPVHVEFAAISGVTLPRWVRRGAVPSG